MDHKDTMDTLNIKVDGPTQTVHTVDFVDTLSEIEKDLNQIHDKVSCIETVTSTLKRIELKLDQNTQVLKTNVNSPQKMSEKLEISGTQPITELVSNYVLVIFALSGLVILLSDLSTRNLFILLMVTIGYNYSAKINELLQNTDFEYYFVIFEHYLTEYYQRLFHRQKTKKTQTEQKIE